MLHTSEDIHGTRSMADNTPIITIGKHNATIKYERRTAVRCIIRKANQVCIIDVKKGNYYKLPGGDVELDDEDDTVTAKREALEETGCEISVKPNTVAFALGSRGGLRQVSHAHICHVESDTGKAKLAEMEESEGLSHQWCSFTEAVEKMSLVEPTSELGHLIKNRDLFLLEKCRENAGEF